MIFKRNDLHPVEVEIWDDDQFENEKIGKG